MNSKYLSMCVCLLSCNICLFFSSVQFSSYRFGPIRGRGALNQNSGMKRERGVGATVISLLKRRTGRNGWCLRNLCSQGATGILVPGSLLQNIWSLCVHNVKHVFSVGLLQGRPLSLILCVDSHRQGEKSVQVGNHKIAPLFFRWCAIGLSTYLVRVLRQKSVCCSLGLGKSLP